MRVELTPSTRIVFVLGDKEYPCTKPKIGAALDLETKLEDAKASGGKGAVKIMLDWVASCGLPEDVARELDPDQLEQVIQALMPAKKNL